MLVASFCAYVENVGVICQDTQVDELTPLEECAEMILPYTFAIQRELAEQGVPMVKIAVGCMPQAEA